MRSASGLQAAPRKSRGFNLGKLLRQTLADMEEQIEESSVTVKAQISAEAVMIHADGSRLYRVFQNLLQNALKYSLDGSRVFITLKTDNKTARATVKNISQEESRRILILPSGLYAEMRAVPTAEADWAFLLPGVLQRRAEVCSGLKWMRICLW